ncbi:hypothetical protein KFK09_004537 [Dendrobium nobile]|uniref:Uncharacterized protein n=1 Tax=Dendrobium nobile TaxID=94219 RepID=A0A8T3C5R9_DENNO|nr:hypothetical protein KFK09_004537 [Dendrobium nobile]
MSSIFGYSSWGKARLEELLLFVPLEEGSSVVYNSASKKNRKRERRLPHLVDIDGRDDEHMGSLRSDYHTSHRDPWGDEEGNIRWIFCLFSVNC